MRSRRTRWSTANPKARAVQFFLDSNVVPINLIGDGLLPADIDGNTKPKADTPIPIVGTQDNGGPYGASIDALNIWDLDVKWRSTPTASITFRGSLPVAPFDSIYPCGVVPGAPPPNQPNARDCLPQPGITNGSQYLDILSYRQRPTWRLAYRNQGAYENLVTNVANDRVGSRRRNEHAVDAAADQPDVLDLPRTLVRDGLSGLFLPGVSDNLGRRGSRRPTRSR